MQILEVPEEDAGLVGLHRQNNPFVEIQVLHERLRYNLIGSLPLHPWLELDARNLLPFAIQVEQVLDLLDGVGYLGVLFVALVFREDIEVVLENVDGLIGLEG